MNDFIKILALVCFSGIIISFIVKQIVWGIVSMFILGIIFYIFKKEDGKK